MPDLLTGLCLCSGGFHHRCELRNEGVIGDEAMHRIERDLDLEESRLEA